MRTVPSLLAVVLVAAVALSGARCWRAGEGARSQFRTLPVIRGDLFIGVSATGTVEPVELVDVGAQIVGCIKQFGPDADNPGKTVDYRSRVRAGAVLAQLDDLPHRAEREKALASVKIAETEVVRARSRQAQTDRDYRRNKNLGNIAAPVTVEAAFAADEQARAEVATAEARLEYARAVLKQTEINLGYTTISSPIDGVIIDRRVNVGQTVVAGLNAPSLFLLAKDLGRMLVWAAVNEADIGDVKLGQKATFQVDAYRDRTYTGRVSQIRLNASMQQNVVTYGVVVDVDNADLSLLPYMTAKLRFEVAGRTGVLLLPNQALRWRPTWRQITPAGRAGLTEPAADARPDSEPTVEVSSPTAWLVADDGLVRPVAVKLGLSDGVTTELLGGDLPQDAPVVVNVAREARPDFVSSFITSVTRKS